MNIIDLKRPTVEIGYCYYPVSYKQHKGLIRVTTAFLPDQGLILVHLNEAYARAAAHTTRTLLLNSLLPDTDPFSFNPDELYIDEVTNQLYTFKQK